MSEKPKVAIRRNLQQLGHCVAEALAVVENDEPLKYAIDDLVHARSLLAEILGRLREVAV